jgi:hypothetical protein
MSSKKSFVLRLDPETMEAIQKWAADEFRSANGQIEWIIARALKEAGRSPKGAKPPTRKKDQDKDL